MRLPTFVSLSVRKNALLRCGFYELCVWILLNNDIDKISFIIKRTQHQIAAT